MITDEQLESLEGEVLAILEDAGWTKVPGPDEGRVEVIAYRACLEAISRACTPRAFHRFNADAVRRIPAATPSDGLSNNSVPSPDREACCCSESNPPLSSMDCDDDRLDPEHPAEWSGA